MHPASAVHRNPHDGIVNIEENTATSTATATTKAVVKSCVADTANTAATTTSLQQDVQDCVTSESAADTASWVGRKVDALLSPVLSFLHSQHDVDII